MIKSIFKVGRNNGLSFTFIIIITMKSIWYMNCMAHGILWVHTTRLDFVTKNNIMIGQALRSLLFSDSVSIWHDLTFIGCLDSHATFVSYIMFALISYLYNTWFIYLCLRLVRNLIPISTIGSVPWMMNLYGFILNICILRCMQQPTTLSFPIRIYPFDVFYLTRITIPIPKIQHLYSTMVPALWCFHDNELDVSML